MKIPRYRIVGGPFTMPMNGKPSFEVIDLETGERIKNITKVVITADHQTQIVHAEIHVIGVELDVSTFDDAFDRVVVGAPPVQAPADG